MALPKSTFDDLAYLESLQSTTSPLIPTASSPKSNAKLAQQAQPSSSTSSNDTRNASKPSTGVYDEQNFDLFSTLFSPSTPRASPDMISGPLRAEETKSKPPPPHLHHRSASISSQSSDFGAFVSVSTFDDPLTAQLRDFDAMLQEPTPTTANGTSNTTAGSSSSGGTGLDVRGRSASRNSSSSSHSASRSLHTNTERPPNSNPTLNFFDQFAQEAKQRSGKRSSLLDELLLHQDDPLYFLKDKNLPSTPSTANTLVPSSPPPPPPPPKSPLTFEDRTTLSPTSNLPSPPVPRIVTSSSSTDSTATLSTPEGTAKPSLDDLNREFDMTHDVDHHYFNVPPSHIFQQANSPSSVLRPTPYSSPVPRTTPNSAYNEGRPAALTRSSSIAIPEPKIAEPVTSIRLASGSPSMAVSTSPPIITLQSQRSASPHHSEREQPPDDDNQEQSGHESGHGQGQDEGHKLSRTPSQPSVSDSLTALSSKWMPTFLRAAGSPGPSPGPAPGGGARPALESLVHDPHAHPDPEPPHHAQTAPLPPPAPQEHSHSASPPASRAHKAAEPTFTHSSAFSPPPLSSSSSILSGLPSLSGTSSSLTSSMSPSYAGYPSTYPTLASSRHTSPFAPHAYVPPSGAPGYAGEGYGARGWDKGYSEELEREMRSSSAAAGDGKADNDPIQTTTQPQPVHSNTLPVPRSGARLEKGRDDNGGRGGWGSGFFGSIRGRNGGTSIASPPAITSPKTNTEAERHEYSNGGGKQGSANHVVNDNPNGGLGAFIEKKSGNVELLGRKEMTAPVLTAELAAKLRPYLPALARLPKAWSLIYSLDQNGISLTTLYSRCEAHTTRKPVPGEVLNTSMLFVMKDAEGAIFGVWLAEGVRSVKANRGYFGGGESFLWKHVDDTLKVFKCTGKNNYVAFCEPDYISFGGGDGHYGLYLDDTLFDGSSAPCPTFNNEPLCSPGPKRGSTVSFECVGLEVWGMGP